MQRFLPSSATLLRWLLAGLAETAVVIPWMLLLYYGDGQGDWTRSLPGAWLPLLIYLMAGLWESGTKQDAPRNRLLAMAVGTLIGYLLAYQSLAPWQRVGLLQWNSAVLFAPVAAYLWYQGASGAIAGLEYHRIFARFRWQFLIQFGGLFLLLLAGETQQPQVQLLLYWSIVLLFGAGLSLLVVTRERALKLDQANLGEQSAKSSTSPAMMAVVGGLLLLTMASSYLLSVERLVGSLGVITPLLNWLVQVAILIIIRWISLFAPLINWLAKNRPTPPPDEGGAPEDANFGSGEELPIREPLDLSPYIRAVFVIGSLVLLAVWLYRLNSRKRVEQQGEEERISLGFWRSLWADLQSLFARPAGADDAGAADDADLIGSDPRNPRLLYRLLQSWGARRARPRRTTETPSRYQDVLAEMRPEAAGQAEVITALYNQARYGPTPPDSEAVEAARKALADLEKGSA